MFIIGLDLVGGETGFDANISTNLDYVEFKNAIYDKCRVDNDVQEYMIDDGKWEFNTVLFAEFNGSLECGNTVLNDMVIERLLFKKRQVGTLDWVLIDNIPYEKDKTMYYTTDNLARSSVKYEYAVVPVASGVQGQMVSDVITCQFEGLRLVDSEQSVKLKYNLNYGDISHNRNISVVQTLGSKYPLIMSSNVEYRSGSNAAVVISKESESYDYNFAKDNQEVEKVVNFLGNRKPKILKDDYGRNYLVMVSDIVETPTIEHNGTWNNLSFNWTEIGDSHDTKTLIASGLLPIGVDVV